MPDSDVRPRTVAARSASFLPRRRHTSALPVGFLARAAVATAALLTLPVLGAAPAPAAPGQAADQATALLQDPDDGLALTATSTYTVDPPGRTTRVVVELSATNQLADVTTPSGVRSFFFDAIGVPVLREATNLSAAVGGTPLAVRLRTDGDLPVAVAVIDLASSLRFGQTQGIRLTYDLPDQPARSRTWSRVNEAYAFVTPLAVGDPGAATVRIVVPTGFEVEVFGSTSFLVEPLDGHVRYSAEAIEDPYAFDGGLIARNTDALVRTEIGGDFDIELRAWPGDAEWTAFLTTQVEEGLPVLEDLVGQPWPVERTLFIDESVSPFVYGYAGWFDSVANTIEIGDTLDALVVYHELAHAWFDHDLFRDRWINEGLAEEFAARTLAVLGLGLPGPQPIDPADPGRVALTGWYTPSLASEISEDRERYGYNTSFTVFRALSEEIGLDGLAAVIDAEASDLIAYQGDPEPELWAPPGDWRRLLDLLEEVGGSDSATELFATHVVDSEQAQLLAAREEARRALAELEEAGAGWTAPLQVRRLLSFWEFGDATEAIEQAHTVLDLRRRLDDEVGPLGVEAPARLEDDYEQASDIDDVERLTSRLLDAAERLAEADRAVEGSHSLFTTIGLIGADVEADLDDARAAFAVGDVVGTWAAAAQAVEGVEDAEGAGQVRVASVPVLLAGGWGATRAVRRLRSRRRETTAGAGEPGEPGRPGRPGRPGEPQAPAAPPDPETNAAPLGDSR